MQQLTLETHVGTDGILHLELPATMKNTDLEVTLTIKPAPTASLEQAAPLQVAEEALDYRVEFVKDGSPCQVDFKRAKVDKIILPDRDALYAR